MKRFPLLKLFALTLILCFAVTGCQRRKPYVTPIPGQRPTVGAPGAGTPLPGGNILTPDNTTGVPINVGDLPQGSREGDDRFNADRETFKDQTVYFDFDSATVKPGEKFKIDAVATYLKSNPTFHVRVEGHCDERGTEEYNRALGERRALAIREVLAAAGIAPDRVSTMSFGENNPAVAGHDEAAYAKNRRGEFVLLRPKN